MAAPEFFAGIQLPDHAGSTYEPVCEWPAGTRVQCGANGVVGTPSGTYRTAFFEAFPLDPATFIRGEGDSVADAEAAAFAKLARQAGCPGHEFERRGYRNGCGVCRHCAMFGSGVFEPLPVTDAERAALVELVGPLEDHSPESLRTAWNLVDPVARAELSYAYSEVSARKWLDLIDLGDQ